MNHLITSAELDELAQLIRKRDGEGLTPSEELRLNRLSDLQAEEDYRNYYAESTEYSKEETIAHIKARFVRDCYLG